MNLVTAIRLVLLQSSAVTSIVGSRVFKNRIFRDVSLTGDVALVISPRGSWAREYTTAKYPRVSVQVHADVSRDDLDRKLADDAGDRALEALTACDAILHRQTREPVWWPDMTGILVLGSERESTESFLPRPGEETMLAEAVYRLKTV